MIKTSPPARNLKPSQEPDFIVVRTRSGEKHVTRRISPHPRRPGWLILEPLGDANRIVNLRGSCIESEMLVQHYQPAATPSTPASNEPPPARRIIRSSADLIADANARTAGVR